MQMVQRLEFEWDEETKRVMVFCRPLGVATSGKDIAEAFEMIGDACAVYWRTLEDLGEEDYKPGKGISVLETHERMRKEGKL